MVHIERVKNALQHTCCIVTLDINAPVKLDPKWFFLLIQPIKT